MTTHTNEDALQTASEDEIARFAAVADQWWDPEGSFAPLHRLNIPRLAFVRDHAAEYFGVDATAERPLAGIRLLDVGCGGGLFSESLALLGADVTAIDAGAESIGIARAHANEAGIAIDYRVATPEELIRNDEKPFDMVIAMEVVEHVADLDGFLGACAALTRPGGAMTFATLNRTVKSLALGKVAAEYLLRWVPAGTHDWKKFVKPSELAKGLRPHGVDITVLSGVDYAARTNGWVLSSRVEVNYLAFAKKN